MLISRCQEDDVSVLLKIFKDVYPWNPRMHEKSYFDWQFRNSKTGEYNFFVSKNEENSITAFIGYIPVGLKNGSENAEACWLVNWYSFSRDASALRLLGKVMSEHDNRLLLGMSDIGLSVYKSFKIPSQPKISSCFAAIDPKALSEVFQITTQVDKEKLYNSCEVLNKLDSLEGKITKIERFYDEEEYQLFEYPSIKKYGVRSGTYLNWRYVDIPNHHYRLIKDGLGHFAVFRFENIMNTEYFIVRILEWTFRGESAQAALKYICQFKEDQHLIGMDFFCTAEEIIADFVSNGFIRHESMQTAVPYLFRPVYYADGISVAVDLPPHKVVRNEDFTEWYITRGDCDVDREKL